MTTEDPSPLDRVAEAVQAFVNAIYDDAPVLLRGGVVTWESMTFDEEGDTVYRVSYAALPDTSMASVIGILDLATDVAKNDMFPDHEED